MQIGDCNQAKDGMSRANKGQSPLRVLIEHTRVQVVVTENEPSKFEAHMCRR